MVSFNLGPLPGTSIVEAADVIASECPLRTIPQLPERGLINDPNAHTVALMPELPIERGPRSWRLTTRPQTLTRRMWDTAERDLDTLEELWGSVDELIFAVRGPWSLATDIELANGHRAVTDHGALGDITEIFIGALIRHAHALTRRFGATGQVIIEEPRLNALAQGKIRGTSDFDIIKPIHTKTLGERLHDVNHELAKEGIDMVRLNLLGSNPPLDVARIAQVPSVLITRNAIKGNQILDELGETLSTGMRVGLGIVKLGDELDEDKEQPRAKAINVAKLFDELGISRDQLTHVDLHPEHTFAPGTLLSHARALACAREAAVMLARDAGDL